MTQASGSKRRAQFVRESLLTTTPEAQRNTDTGRLDRLETVQEQQSRSLTNLARVVETLADETRDGFKELREEFSKIGRISWPLILTTIGLFLSAASVFVVIGTMALSPMSKELTSIRADIKETVKETEEQRDKIEDRLLDRMGLIEKIIRLEAGLSRSGTPSSG